MTTIAAVLTSFNRREKTLAALRALHLQQLPADACLNVYLTDDGSTDGSSEAVLAEFPGVNVLPGSGQLFWNGGMRVAMLAAERSSPDYFLWLNDDTMLDETAVSTLLEITANSCNEVIAVAATRDPVTLAHSYGGVVRPHRFKPVTFALVPVSESVQRCESMNGNCVLIPIDVYRRLGPMNEKFRHAMGDLDYGLRARSAGFQILIAPGTLGTCKRNDGGQRAELGPWQRIKAMQHPKGLPLSDWRTFTSAHAGPLWPVYWLWPYAKALLSPSSLRHAQCGVENSEIDGRLREVSRLAIMVNMVAPYRLPVYEHLARTFEVLVLHGGDESNRQWKPVQSNQPHLRIKKTWSCKIGIKKKIKMGGIQDQQFLHFNLGAVKDLLAFRPHVLITNEMGIRTVVALAYGTLARIPVWIWWGGTLHSERDIYPFKRFCRKLIARSSKYWISYGITSTEYLESLTIPRTAVLEIQNCVDESLYTCMAPEQIVFPVRPAGIVVGQVIARKGLNLLLESCARVQCSGLLFSMTIVGGGEDMDLLKQYAAELGLKNVIFTGNRSREQVLTYYKGADFLVFPTLEDTWGLVVNEALLAGLPVLCSKHAGCARELVPEEAQFDPLDHESFDASLTRAIHRHLPKPDITRLKPYRQVAEMITASLLEGRPTQVIPESWECA